MSILSILMKSDPDEPLSGPRDDCPLCHPTDEALIWRGAFWRVIDARDPNYPGYVRLTLNRHVTELSWLAKPEEEQLFRLLPAIERLMRSHLQPDKINLASLGNQVSHMHWHIIGRWRDDPHFPHSIWSQSKPADPSPELPGRKQAALEFLNKLPKVCAKAVY